MKGELAQGQAGTCKGKREALYMNGNGCAKEVVEHGSETLGIEHQKDNFPAPDSKSWHLEMSDENSTKTSDSEIRF